MRRSLIGIGATIGLTVTAAARADSPTVSRIFPVGGQRGTEVTVQFYGRNLKNADRVLCYEQGIEILSVIGKSASACAVRLRIAKDCAIGSQRLHLCTNRGIANVVVFFVGDRKELIESEPLNNRAPGQKIPLNTTINGRITADDLDQFAFDVDRPRTIQVEVVGVRLGYSTIDGHLTVLGPSGNTITEVEDSAWGRMDPVVSVHCKAAGTYRLQLRDSRLRSDNNATYRLSVGEFPRPVGHLPVGGRPGEKIQLHYLGPDSSKAPIELTLPTDKRFYAHYPSNTHGSAPSGMWLSITDLPNHIEPLTRKDTQPLKATAPGALNGRIGKPGESDRWRFHAKKGQRFTVMTLARRLRSPLDPVFSLREIKGKFRAYGDDTSGHPDGRIDFRVPADGEYELVIRDHLRRGGPTYFYRVEFSPVRSVPSATSLRPGRRDAFAVSVPQGGRMGTVLSLGGVAAKTVPAFEAVPEGLTTQAAAVTPGTRYVPVVWSATDKAKRAASLSHPTQEQNKRTTRIPYQLAMPLLRVRNNRTYIAAPLDALPLAVVDPLPFGVDVDTPKTPVVQGSPTRLRVRLERKKGYTGAVRLTPLWSPPGVSIGSTTVAAGKTVAYLPVTAQDSAAPRTWQIAVVGTVSRNSGLNESCSALVPLRVAPKPLTVQWTGDNGARLRGEQGETMSLTGQLRWRDKTTPQPIVAELLRLPSGVTAAKVEIAPTQTKVDAKSTFLPLRLQLKLSAKARPGRHRPLLRLRIGDAKQPWLQDVRGIDLRVDRIQPTTAKPQPATPTKGQQEAPR